MIKTSERKKRAYDQENFSDLWIGLKLIIASHEIEIRPTIASTDEVKLVLPPAEIIRFLLMYQTHRGIFQHRGQIVVWILDNNSCFPCWTICSIVSPPTGGFFISSSLKEEAYPSVKNSILVIKKLIMSRSKDMMKATQR